MEKSDGVLQTENNSNPCAAEVDFFLGANSPHGFFSYFDELTDPALVEHCYIIKGCPGSGKSTMMKQCVKQGKNHELLIEKIHCSSDPASLDGVLLHNSRTTIADGTLPHTIEPLLPVAYETIISLFDCFDSEKVAKKRSEAFSVNRKIKDCHRRCCSYMAGAQLLLHDNRHIASECTNYPKIHKLAQRIAQREFPDRHCGRGVERKRLLSAITPNGVVSYPDTVSALCERVYVIKDEYSAASRVLLKALKEFALSRGYQVFCCYCTLEGTEKPEHLLIPELGLGFVTENQYFTYQGESYRVIHYSRFTDLPRLKQKKQRLAFNKRAAKEILKEAVKALEQAKAYHDELEQIYGAGINFDQINRMSSKLSAEIAGYYR